MLRDKSDNNTNQKHEKKTPKKKINKNVCSTNFFVTVIELSL